MTQLMGLSSLILNISVCFFHLILVIWSRVKIWILNELPWIVTMEDFKLRSNFFIQQFRNPRPRYWWYGGSKMTSYSTDTTGTCMYEPQWCVLFSVNSSVGTSSASWRRVRGNRFYKYGLSTQLTADVYAWGYSKNHSCKNLVVLEPAGRNLPF